MKIKKKLGRPFTGKATKRLSVSLPAGDIIKLREIGNGNASMAIRILLARECSKEVI